MKHDCNKTLDYFSESIRMCYSAYDGCCGCPFQGKTTCPMDPDAVEIETYIREVQQWSDEHPEEEGWDKHESNKV